MNDGAFGRGKGADTKGMGAARASGHASSVVHIMTEPRATTGGRDMTHSSTVSTSTGRSPKVEKLGCRSAGERCSCIGPQ